MDIILFGPPGAGKGTQAGLLQQRLGLLPISTGALLRARAAISDELGQELEAIISRGELVPDGMTVGILRERLNEDDCARGVIFDGFPRTQQQAEILDEMLADMDRPLRAVVHMQVNDDILIDRISGRFSCAQCGQTYHDRLMPTKVAGVCDSCGSDKFTRRSDDNPDTMRVRLAAFNQQTRPLLAYYENSGLLKTIDGLASVEEVTRQLMQAIDVKTC
ncbi:MAG: adenylate kinase [Alphaproteobacteria bacterium]|nr:MAG: adenylate kinase [Alphaproteobacteria bacterium]